MNAAAELGRNPVSKHQIQPEYEMSRLTRDGTPEPVSRDQILRRERGQGKIIFPCSADNEQDCQPYPVDPYPCYMKACLRAQAVTQWNYSCCTIDSPEFRMLGKTIFSTKFKRGDASQ